MLTNGSTSSMMTVTMLSGRVVSRWGSAASCSRMLAYCGWSARQKSVGSDEFTNGCQNWRTTVERGSRKAAQALTRVRIRAAIIARVLARADTRLDLKTRGFAGAATDSVLSRASSLAGDAVAASGKPLG